MEHGVLTMSGAYGKKPLTEDELAQFTKAAEETKPVDELLAIIPSTGLYTSEFSHLHRDWISGLTDPLDVDSERDSLVIRVPDDSRCEGLLKGSRRNALMEFEERKTPCKRCENRGGRWNPPSECRVRTIPVVDKNAKKRISWWFDQYHSIPLNKRTVSKRAHRIAEKAGIEKEVSPVSLRNTYGTLLLKMGFSAEEIAEAMGYYNKYKTRHIFKAIGEPVDWSQYGCPVSERALLEELRNLYKELGKIPTAQDMRERGEFSPHLYQYRFGGVVAGRRAAGLREQE